MALHGSIPGRQSLVPFFVLLGSCALADPDFDTVGVVRFHDVAGGLWAIEAGRDHLEPINLPAEFRVDGLRVTFEANSRDDPGVVRHVGCPVELEFIQMTA